MIKNVLVVVVHPDGRREPLAIGLPGDREVDEKRLGAQLDPAEVEAFTETDFAANPSLQKGYIGPRALGTDNASGRAISGPLGQVNRGISRPYQTTARPGQRGQRTDLR